MEELTEREQELKSIPELRRLAMSVAGNPTMKTIMSCVAGSVEYGERVQKSGNKSQFGHPLPDGNKRLKSAIELLMSIGQES